MWSPKERAAAFAAWVERLLEVLADERFHPKREIPLTIAGTRADDPRPGRAIRRPLEHVRRRSASPPRRRFARRARTTRASTSSARETGRTVLRSALLGYHAFVAETPWRSDEAFADVVERWQRRGLRRARLLLPAGHRDAGGVRHARRVRARVLRQRVSRRRRRSRAHGAQEASRKVRPKTPSRVKKRTRRKSRGARPSASGADRPRAGSRSACSWAAVLYAGWNGGYVGRGDRRRPRRRGRRDRLRAAGRLRRRRRADGRRRATCRGSRRSAPASWSPRSGSRSCSAAGTAATSGAASRTSSVA